MKLANSFCVFVVCVFVVLIFNSTSLEAGAEEYIVSKSCENNYSCLNWAQFPFKDALANDTIPCTQNSVFYQVLEGNKFVFYNPLAYSGFTIVHVNSYETNAIGYNVEDGYIYGIRRSSNHLVRIGSSGVFEDLGAVAGLPIPYGSGYFTGDCDLSGNLFVTNTYLNTIYQIDINQQAVVHTYLINEPLDAADFAYLPSDGKFYGVTNDNDRLVSFDPNTGIVSFLGYLDLYCGFGSGYGAAFADNQGFLYVFCNQSGTLYRVNPETLEVELIQDTPESLTSNDGAACALSDGLQECIPIEMTAIPNGQLPDTCCFIMELHSEMPNLISGFELQAQNGVNITPMMPLNGWQLTYFNEDELVYTAPNGVAPLGSYFYGRICLSDFQNEPSPEVVVNYFGLTEQGICSDTLQFNCGGEVTSFISSPLFLYDVRVSPNPFEDQIRVKSPGSCFHLMVEIVDMRGRVVLAREILGDDVLINTSSLSSNSIYLVKLVDENGFVYVCKMMKQ